MQYRRERYNLMLLAWNASSSIIKQKDCKNKQLDLPKQPCLNISLFSYHLIEDIKNFLRDCFFVQNLFDIKRFSNKIVFKFSKNLELKIVNDPKIIIIIIIISFFKVDFYITFYDYKKPINVNLPIKLVKNSDTKRFSNSLL